MKANPCPQCGQALAENCLTCSNCHCAMGLDALAGVDPNIRIKNQKLAAWYGLLLGGLGVHRFYLGQHLKGSLYLAFSWTLVPVALGWFDAFKTFRMSPFTFQSKYAQRPLTA
ncbi:NINE protein [Shewanella corallii]|uniref:NINE protein n=2 Tax=Shewanella TaxID=22 RepID=A0ABT0N849_9GAMM|nr:NINE protein [Shewanella submarina]MCL2914584.1 NINE protein [Shewanella corallii]